MRGRATILVLLLGAGTVMSTALAAQGWGAFDGAFPSHPCMDGWVACRVDGQLVDPELRGTPAHWRVDWWSLEPTGAFSAFPKWAGRPVSPRRPLDPVVISIGEVAELEQEAERARLTASSSRRSSSSRRPTRSGRVGTTDSSCSDLQTLEPTALRGKLSDEQKRCLDHNIAASEKMTDKGKISRVLMVDAYVAGERSRWEGLVRRHLDEIDQSDPDLAYKYALQLSKHGPSRALGVIRWSTVALDNKSVWEGDVFTSRVFSLHRTRTLAASSLWEQAAKQLADDPTDENKTLTDQYRLRTKTFSREWAAYGREAGKDISQAVALCKSAASDSAACDL